MSMHMLEVAPLRPCTPEFNGDMAKHIAVLGSYGGSRWLARDLLGGLRDRNDVEEVTYTPLDVSLNNEVALQEAVKGAYVFAPSVAMAAIRRHKPVGMKQVDAVVPVEPQSPKEQLTRFACLNAHELTHVLTGPDRLKYAQLVVGKLGCIAMHPVTHLAPSRRRMMGETSTRRTFIKMRGDLCYEGVEFNVHAFGYGDQMGFNLCHKDSAYLRSKGVNGHTLRAPYADHELFFRRPQVVIEQVYGSNPPRNVKA